MANFLGKLGVVLDPLVRLVFLVLDEVKSTLAPSRCKKIGRVCYSHQRD